MKVALLIAGNLLVKVSVENIEKKSRGRSGETIIPNQFSYATQFVVGEENDSVLVVLTDNGKLYKKDIDLIKFESKYDSQVIELSKLFDFEEGVEPNFAQLAIVKKEVFNLDTVSFAFATQQGLVKKTLANEFSSSRSNGVIAIGLNEGDKVVGFTVLDENKTSDIFLFSSKGNLCRINASEFRTSSRTSMGVYGMGVKDDAKVVSISSNLNGENLVWTICSSGKGKASNVEEFSPVSRGKKVGVRTHKVTDKTGAVVSGCLVKEGEENFILALNRRVLRMDVSEINVMGRNCEGVKLINIPEDSRVLLALKA